MLDSHHSPGPQNTEHCDALSTVTFVQAEWNGGSATNRPVVTTGQHAIPSGSGV